MSPESLPPPDSVEDAMMLMGTLSSAPTTAPRSEGVRAGASGPGVSGQAVHQRRLHPRHRKAVAGFFDGESDR